MEGEGNKILAAVFDDGINRETISVERLNTEHNTNRFLKHLFCLTQDCEARLSIGKSKAGRKYFRTYPSTPHSKECDLENNEYSGNAINYGNEKKIIPSDKHIQNVLMRAFDKIKGTTPPRNPNGGGNNRTGIEGDEIKDRYVNVLSGDADSDDSIRQPYIYTKFYNEIKKVMTKKYCV